MQHVVSDTLADFAAFYDEDVELISITRPRAQSSQAYAQELLSSRGLPPSNWVQEAGDANALADALSASVCPTLVGEITQATEVVSDLLGCQRVDIRLEILSQPM
ncbi:MAG: DUF1826 domain-containing protein, partial [Pseudomonadota bacterium]